MDGELLSLKWNNHRTTFYHVISGLRNKETYTDVTLACEGKFYPVHKLVLSTCSEYFSDIFDRTPCKNPVVVLKDIHCQDLEFLLDYMYIGEVNVRQNELSSLIKAAECLRIKGLAVPDEEPKKAVSGTSGSNNASGSSGQTRQRPEQASPPAKRRRGEERRSTVTEPSPGRPPGDTRTTPDPDASSHTKPVPVDPSEPREHSTVDKQSDLSTEAVHIKVEQDNFEQPGNDDFLSIQSNSYDGGGGEDGDGQRGSEGNTSDFPEFLQSTIEKEEPVMSDFNPSDFAGPSGLQNSGIAWENENSSASFGDGISGAVAAAVAAASQPQQQQQQQQQRQQQQLCGSRAVGVGVYDLPSTTHHRTVDQLLPSLPWPLPIQPHSQDQQLQHTPPRIYKCPYCKHVTQKKFNLTKHIRTHTGERPFHCKECMYSTGDPSNLKSHYKLKHAIDKIGTMARSFEFP